MHRVTLLFGIILAAALLTACASEPPPPPLPVLQPPSWGGWLYFEDLSHQIAAEAASAGRDPNEAYRSSMMMNCANYRLQLTGEARAKADAECAAIAAMPRPAVTDCNPNNQGGIRCKAR